MLFGVFFDIVELGVELPGQSVFGCDVSTVSRDKEGPSDSMLLFCS